MMKALRESLSVLISGKRTTGKDGIDSEGSGSLFPGEPEAGQIFEDFFLQLCRFREL